MKIRFKNRSLQAKISIVYVLANLLVFIVNVVLLFSVNNMSNDLDMVYAENRSLNQLVNALDQVQDSMTEYLNVKTSDALEAFYRSEQAYRNEVETLEEEITGEAFDRMERNIKRMSETYLDQVAQTIEAKRGRNVEKYKVRYENATRQYGYISTYLSSLNQEKFEANSEHYSTLSKSFRRFETISIVIISVMILGNILLMTNSISVMVSPLRKLASAADAVAKGNFDVDHVEVDTEDEVGIVSQAFNKMVDSIREYIERIRQQMEVERDLKERELRMETHLKDAQLKYLQAQINPHFLYNTLNAGAQLAMMEGADRTYDYVQNVAQFFRYNMKKSNDLVTVGEEIRLVDYYISILNVRFSGDIHYEKEVDESLLELTMPGMTLQPIVENCVNHGIREIMGEGCIRLKVYATEECACISIRDNGRGMTEEEINRVMNGTYKEQGMMKDSNGVGMDNVISRLKFFAGKEILHIYSEGEGKGVEVTILLPRT